MNKLKIFDTLKVKESDFFSPLDLLKIEISSVLEHILSWSYDENTYNKCWNSDLKELVYMAINWELWEEYRLLKNSILLDWELLDKFTKMIKKDFS